jgi:sulfur-carrier protein
MQIVYFARVREAVGIDGESADLPDHIVTIADCVQWLIARGGPYPAAFADTGKLRFALDQQMVAINAPVTGAQELAIFPPVTGG